MRFFAKTELLTVDR